MRQGSWRFPFTSVKLPELNTKRWATHKTDEGSGYICFSFEKSKSIIPKITKLGEESNFKIYCFGAKFGKAAAKGIFFNIWMKEEGLLTKFAYRYVPLSFWRKGNVGTS